MTRDRFCVFKERARHTPTHPNGESAKARTLFLCLQPLAFSLRFAVGAGGERGLPLSFPNVPDIRLHNVTLMNDQDVF